MTIRFAAHLKFLFGLMIWLIVGCSGTTPEQQTFVAQHATRSTEMAIFRQTAAFEEERRQITLEAVATAEGLARRRQSDLISTLSELGVIGLSMDAITPIIRTEAPEIQATALAASAAANFSGGGITRIPPTPDFRTAPPAVVTQAQVPPTVDPNAPGLRSMGFASGVDSNNCALDNLTQFTTSTPEIYATAVTQNILTGTTIAVRWFKDGAETALYNITAEVDLNGTCVYIFVDQTDFTFDAGSQYSAVWELNGTRFGEPVPFAVVEG